MRKHTFFLLSSMMAFAAEQQRSIWPSDDSNQANPYPSNERPKRLFRVKGKEIEAESLKDAKRIYKRKFEGK